MNLKFFYVNDTTNEVLDDPHYIDRVSSMAIEAFRAGEFASIKDANARYFEMEHGFSKYSFDADKESMREAVKRLTGIESY